MSQPPHEPPNSSGEADGGARPVGSGTPVQPPEAIDIDLVAAALRSDRSDLAGLFRVLADTLPESLPEGWAHVERDRTLSDRVAGRPGTPSLLRVEFADACLTLAEEGGHLVAESRHVVRGIVLSRRRIGVDEWVRELASALAGAAQHDARAREALTRLLSGA